MMLTPADLVVPGVTLGNSTRSLLGGLQSLVPSASLLAILLKKILTMESGQFFTTVSSKSWHSSAAFLITWYYYHCFD